MPEDDETTTDPASSTSTNAEPARATGLAVGIASLLFSGMVLFGINISADARGWIMLAISVLGPAVAGLMIRGKVFSPATVEVIKETAQRDVGLANQAITALQAEKTAMATAHDTGMKGLADTLPRVIASVLEGHTAQQAPAQHYQASSPMDQPTQAYSADNQNYGPAGGYAYPSPYGDHPYGGQQ